MFRSWVLVPQAGQSALPVIWGQCIVHFGNPEFSGRVLHTSGVVEVGTYKSVQIVETRNNLYALLGPQLELPHGERDPAGFLERAWQRLPPANFFASAAMNADPRCKTCSGTGVRRTGGGSLVICDACCPHNQGWWQLESAYGENNGRWACKAGCGHIVDTPTPLIEFLPRATL